MADIFSPLQINRCQPKSRNNDVHKIQHERADFTQTGLVENTKGVDFCDQIQGEMRVQVRGQKKCDTLRDYGVKSGVGSTDELYSGKKRTEDPRQPVSLTFKVVTSETIPISEQDPGQGRLSQNQP